MAKLVTIVRIIACIVLFTTCVMTFTSFPGDNDDFHRRHLEDDYEVDRCDVYLENFYCFLILVFKLFVGAVLQAAYRGLALLPPRLYCRYFERFGGCVCGTAGLRSRIKRGVKNIEVCTNVFKSDLFFPFFVSDPIDISGKSFTLSCSPRDIDGCLIRSKSDSSLLFVGSPANVTFKGLRMDPFNKAFGGAMSFSGGKVNIQDCSFASLEAEKGSAIYLENTELVLKNTVFAGNEATGDAGGAIYASGNSFITMENTTFHNNEGRAMYLTGSSLVVSDSEYRDNLYSENSTVAISNSLFRSEVTALNSKITLTETEFFYSGFINIIDDEDPSGIGTFVDCKLNENGDQLNSFTGSMKGIVEEGSAFNNTNCQLPPR